MTLQRILIAALVILVIGAAIYMFQSEDNAQACSGKGNTPRIVAFGDSLVYGYGATSEGGFVSLLSSGLGVPVINLGKNGDTTSSAKERLDAVVKAKPSITLVLLGGNDALRRVPQAETEQNLRAIIEEIQKTGSRVMLLGVIGGFPDPYSSMYSRLAKEYELTYVQNILSGIIGRTELMSDSIHPNQAGYQKIADRIFPVLEKECSGLSTD